MTKRFHREIMSAQLAEKDRVITALAEQVEWLRMIIGRPALGQAINPTQQPTRMISEKPFMSEMEEEIEFLVKDGQLDPEQAAEALQEFGLGDDGPELDF
jgi:hypothetical protein